MANRPPVLLVLLLWSLTATACTDELGVEPFEWAPVPSSEQGEARVGALRIVWQLVSQEPVDEHLDRSTYDVTIENLGIATEPGCARLATPTRPLLPSAILVGDGRLAPGVRARHRGAMTFEHEPERGVHDLDLVWQPAPDGDCPRTPNVVVILADDMGYGDPDPAGDFAGLMPRVDDLRREGLELSAFYSAPTCSVSRAELMTGSYAQRVGVGGAYDPWSLFGLHPDEITLAEVAAERGYVSALIGKWHLGAWKPFLPLAQGFDEYFGIPYTNNLTQAANRFLPKLPLYDGETVIEREPDQSQLTRRFTERAVDFIERNADVPFLLVVAHPMPHVPLSVSEEFAGRSDAGLYGDVLMELDWSTGEILDALSANGIDDDTLVIFTSDNGPWLRFGEHAGSAGPLREGKSTTFEGGVRVPALLRWPGRIEADRSHPAITGLIDVLPTLADLLGLDLPADRIIDGQSLAPLFAGPVDPDAGRPSHAFFVGGSLQAVRSGRFKLHLPHGYPTVVEAAPGGGTIRAETIDLSLFDLWTDVGEQVNVAASMPEPVETILQEVDRTRLDLGDTLLGLTGAGVRPEGDLNTLPLP